MARQYTLQRHPSAVTARIDFAAELNPQQCEAVTAPPGPALVIAGAGSGKTRTLTYRVAYLIENGVVPSNILLLTFTNKAAREMLDRVAALIPNDVTGLWGGTFHSVGNRLLRKHPEAAGFAPGFSIMDREDQQDHAFAWAGGPILVTDGGNDRRVTDGSRGTGDPGLRRGLLLGASKHICSVTRVGYARGLGRADLGKQACDRCRNVA